MKLDQWLEAVPGRARAMAAHFQVTESGVHDWKVNGVPRARLIAVSEYTGNAVTVLEMLEDGQAKSKAIAKDAPADKKRTVKRRPSKQEA